MHVLDIILLLCFIPFIIQGITKGFVAQITAIISVVLGVWMSFHFMEFVCTKIQPYINASDSVLKVIAFAAILIVVILALTLIGRALEHIIKLVMLGWLNRLLGIVFALVEGLLIIGLAIILFSSLNAHFEFVSAETLNASALYNPIKEIAYTVFPYLKELMFK